MEEKVNSSEDNISEKINNEELSKDQSDREKNNQTPTDKESNDKLWAALAYILFFIPLLKSNRSEFVTFHTNQGTLFFIFAAGGNLILSAIPVIGWALLPVFFIFVIVFFVMGILNALSGKMKKLPWFGHLEIIK